jgi:hypothetical protein
MEEIGKILPDVLKSRVRAREGGLAEILAPFWPRVAGKPIAQHSRPVDFHVGTLTLWADSSAWATELCQLAEEIRAEINCFLGLPIVKKLRIEQRGAEEELRPPFPRLKGAAVRPRRNTRVPRIGRSVY